MDITFVIVRLNTDITFSKTVDSHNADTHIAIQYTVKLSCCGYICFRALTHFLRPNNKICCYLV